MAYFLIKYIGLEGGVQTKSVEATTREQAISLSGIPESIVQGVTPDLLGGIRSSLMEKRFSKNEQILSLVTLASKLESGKTAGRAILEAIDYEKIDVTRAQLEACEMPSDYLKVLRFDETAILLAEAGDKSGRLAESLQRAAHVIKQREKARKEFAKPMKMATINATVGIAAGVGFPMFGGSMLHKFIYEQKFPIEPTMLSRLLMWLNEFYSSAWPAFLGVLVVSYIFRSRLWSTVRDWPFFSLFNNRLRTKRGLDFIQTYQLLTTSGYTNPQVFKFMLERAKGHQHELFSQALQRLREGRELGQVFNDPEWPRIITQNLAGFEQQTPDGRDKVLTNLADALTEMFTQYSEKIAGTLSKISMVIILSSILLFALGFYVPMMTMRVGLQ